MAKELEEDRYEEFLGEDLELGHDPFGDADPGSCGAQVHECEMLPNELSAAPERSEVPMTEEMMEPFVPEKTVFGTDPEDGLPVAMDQAHELQEAPPFRYDTFICIEDERTFVEIFLDESEPLWKQDPKIQRSLIEKVQGALGRSIRFAERYLSDGSEAKRRSFDAAAVRVAFGVPYVLVNNEIVFVRPARPRCEHLRRQVFNVSGTPEGEPGHFVVFRNCAARRSVGGAMMSLRDEAVYACEHRSPPDLESARRHIDEPDRRRLERVPVRLPMFHDGKPAAPAPTAVPLPE